MINPRSPLAPRIEALFAASLIAALASGCAPGAGDDSLDPYGRNNEPLGDGTAYTLWIHGRSPGGQHTPGDYTDFSYWGPGDVSAGVNKKAVNWDGAGRIADTNAGIRDALDCFCTGENFCYVVVHSAGNLQIGYALDFYGSSEREIKDATPGADGRCGGTGGTQTGWNIKWVDVAAGAAGGSELADLGYWAASDALTSDLRTGTARTLYDHNNTQGVMFYMFAGANGTAYSGVLPGQDDEAVAYHSSGGLAATGSFCNPGNWFCDGTLNLADQGSKKGKSIVPKYANHYTAFRDDKSQLNHYTKGAWKGVVSAALEDIQNSAR